jgi:hypothetical protein
MDQMTVCCPECGHAVTVPTQHLGDQLHCPQCGTVYSIVMTSSQPAQRDLVADESPWCQIAEPYRILRGHGISPASTLDAIHEVFPDTDDEEKATRTLQLTRTRLPIDLFFYPFRANLEQHSGSPQ